MQPVETVEELAQKIKEDADYIEISVELKGTIIKIKATNKAVWGAVLVALVIAYGLFVASPATGGASAIASMAIAAPAVSVLGVGAFTTALLLSKAFGSTDVLDKLREYDMEERGDGILVLTKK